MSLRQQLIKKLVNFYPPFFGCGVKVKRSESGGFLISMKLHWWNRNYVGTHFGGSLYLMTDPWFMLILMERLGRDYLVWDQKASIDFKSPGRGKVLARFEISQAEVDEVIRTIKREGVARPQFIVEITDEEGKVIAVVEKGLWAALKKKD